ncbi:MAG: tetraacyldisaccharide 4'-kinase [Alphaproteobacteria bacterium]|nr:tetraacyldisaccharide 4'-kinase [Alphaproteobacteria bacterium]
MRAPNFWRHRGITAYLLAPLGAIYNASVAFKAAYASPYRAPMPVICVGNLTAGGSGKTPVTIAIGEMLRARGKNPAFLIRGYGGRSAVPTLVKPHHTARQVGDEALLLARSGPTIVAADRATGAAKAAALKADVLVMDDGHQNFGLAKNLSLVVVDGSGGFQNGMVLPAGPLREKVAQGLKRADAVILMGEGTPDLDGYAGPVLRAHLKPMPNDLAGRRVFAFAGIGRPQKFYATLKAVGAFITGTQDYADHHFYDAKDLQGLRDQAKDALLVTTEKDLVRIPPERRGGIVALAVEARFDDPAALDALLRKAVP